MAFVYFAVNDLVYYVEAEDKQHVTPGVGGRRNGERIRLL